MLNQLKVLMYLLSCCIIWSCSDSNKYIKLLEEKNQQLSYLNQKLENEINSLSFTPIVIPKSNIIKLGEEYIADVRLAVTNKNNPPIFILCKYDNSLKECVSTGDTIEYNFEHETSIYRNIPKEKGRHQWSGKIIQKIMNKDVKFNFTVEYDVN